MSNVTTIEAPPRAVSDGADGLTVELYDGHELAAAGWPSLSADPGLLMHVYQSREFLSVWMGTIGKARNARCVLVVVKDTDERPIMYLPLCLETKLRTCFLRFMDAGVSDFNAPIVTAGRSLTQREFVDVWQRILAQLPGIDVVDLQKMPCEVGAARNPLTYLSCHPHRSSGHAIDLERWKELAPTRRPTARMRKEFIRRSRKLNAVGEVAFLVNPSRPHWDQVMDRLIELKRKKYRRTSIPDFLSTPGVHDFYREIAAPDRLGHVSHLSAMTCGGSVVSAHLGFVARGRFYYVLPAFDTEYGTFAVGQLLLDHLVEGCIKDGYTTFDLGEGDLSYKEKWATHSQPLMSHARGLTTVGRVYDRLRHVRRTLRTSRFYEKYLKSGARFAARHADELAL
jgi:CelD/BcsL family acetyltransferase involved in cellulose biosynthesis